MHTCNSVSFSDVHAEEVSITRIAVGDGTTLLEEELFHGGKTCQMCLANICCGDTGDHDYFRWLYDVQTKCCTRSKGWEIPDTPNSSMFLLSLPPVLPIQIERSDFDREISAITFNFNELDFPVVGLDIKLMMAVEPPEGACTIYDLKFMTKRIANGFRKLAGTKVEAPEGRYVGYAKSGGDGDWYEYDVCSGTKRSKAMEGARRTRAVRRRT